MAQVFINRFEDTASTFDDAIAIVDARLAEGFGVNVWLSEEFETREAAAARLAEFGLPKSVNAKIQQVYRFGEGTHYSIRCAMPGTMTRRGATSDATGVSNETGRKRIERFLRAVTA